MILSHKNNFTGLLNLEHTVSESESSFRAGTYHKKLLLDYSLMRMFKTNTQKRSGKGSGAPRVPKSIYLFFFKYIIYQNKKAIELCSRSGHLDTSSLDTLVSMKKDETFKKKVKVLFNFGLFVLNLYMHNRYQVLVPM